MFGSPREIAIMARDAALSRVANGNDGSPDNSANDLQGAALLMNRRNFLRTLIGGVASAAAVRTFPFRVFSFPKEIKLASSWEMYGEMIYLHPVQFEPWKELRLH